MGLWAFIFGCIGIGIALMAIGVFVIGYSTVEGDSFQRLSDTLWSSGVGMFLIGIGTLAYALLRKK